MRDPVGIVLVVALWMTAVIAIWDSVDNAIRVKRLQDLYLRQPEINNLNVAAQSLANEAMEYSKKNPAIDPILIQFELKARPAATATNQPATNQPALKPQ